MKKQMFKVSELIGSEGWRLEDVDSQIAKSRTFGLLREFAALETENKRQFVVYDAWNEELKLDLNAWNAYEATDYTARDAQTFAFDRDKMPAFSSHFINSRDGFAVATKSFIEVVDRHQFRRGDRILRVTEPTEKTSYTMLPSTIRVVEVYHDYNDYQNGKKVKVRCVIEEALANADENARAFEEASTDERRTISQNLAAAETSKAAKMLGGSELEGTPAQKKWAEDIRKATLSTVTAEVADKLLSKRRFQKANWWIEHRGDVKTVAWLTSQAAR